MGKIDDQMMRTLTEYIEKNESELQNLREDMKLLMNYCEKTGKELEKLTNENESLTECVAQLTRTIEK